MHDPRASAAEHHSWNVAGFAKLLEYVAQFQVPKLVVLSSANVYGPQPEQPAVPDRGGAAARRARTSATSATSSRSTCSRRASSGSSPRPRRSSCARSTSSGSVHNAAVELPAPQPDPHGPGLRPDGPGHPRGRRRARHPARAPARRPRHLQPRGPRAGAALAPHQDPRAPAPQRPLLARARRPAAGCGRCASPPSRRRSSITSATSAWSTTAARARCSASRRGCRSRRPCAPSTTGAGSRAGARPSACAREFQARSGRRLVDRRDLPLELVVRPSGTQQVLGRRIGRRAPCRRRRTASPRTSSRPLP